MPSDLAVVVMELQKHRLFELLGYPGEATIEAEKQRPAAGCTRRARTEKLAVRHGWWSLDEYGSVTTQRGLGERRMGRVTGNDRNEAGLPVSD
jgi:hypothetical protein